MEKDRTPTNRTAHFKTYCQPHALQLGRCSVGFMPKVQNERRTGIGNITKVDQRTVYDNT